MVKNKKFQKMPKISLGQKQVFLEFPNRSQNAIVRFLQCFVIGMGASSFTMFSEGAPSISFYCVSLGRAKHQFLLRFLRGARNIGPIGSTRVGPRWVGPSRSRVGLSPKIACEGGEPLWKVTKNNPGSGANLEFVSSSFSLPPHFFRENPPFSADLSSKLFFSRVTGNEEAFNHDGKKKVPKNTQNSL